MFYNLSLSILLSSSLFSTLFCMESKMPCKSLYLAMENFLRNYNNKNAAKKTIDFLKQCSESMNHDTFILDNLIIYAYEHQTKKYYSIQPSLSEEYIIVYTQRLKNYFDVLENKQFATPTHEQFKHHLENLNTLNTIQKKIHKAHSMGIILSEKNVLPNSSLHLIPTTIAFDEFKALLDNTRTILLTKPSDLQDIKKEIYNKIKNQSKALNNL